ncbi:sodium-coupled monocarboxylate transporter 2-like [Oratosquilla oratoria]|uniref:sodium-coupled monocarboxylate transporter 2-like n=2 Tax=Oratosquilla oratoria TaxID=337810 RepID=UPI003F75DAAD
MTDTSPTFTAVDYVVFGGVLFFSLFIGLYHAFRVRNRDNAEFLMGSYNLSWFPVSMSMLATYISAILVLGGPAEAYYHGMMYLVVLAGQVAKPIVAVTFLPVFYKLRLVSVYEYLEMRFRSRAIRLFGGGTFVVQIVLYLAVVIYAPALALASVMGFPVWASIVLVGVIGTVYTALGGMRAVVWTDMLQLSVLLLGMVAIIIKGTIDVGGPANVWRTSVELSRTGQDFKYPFSLYERHTVCNLFLTSFLGVMTAYGCHQTMIQRYNSLPRLREAYMALASNVPMSIILIVTAFFTGLVLLTVYKDCDPLAAGLIQKKDQILPFYVVERLRDFPGFAGLFVACLFSGALRQVELFTESQTSVPPMTVMGIVMIPIILLITITTILRVIMLITTPMM